MPVERFALGNLVLVRLLASIMDASSLAVGCFADDLAAAARRVSEAMPPLMRAFALVRKATHLTATVRTTRLVYFGERLLAAVAEEMEAIAGERMVVDGSGVYLSGFPSGPTPLRGLLGRRVVAKVRRATRHIASFGLTVSDRVRVPLGSLGSRSQGTCCSSAGLAPH